MSESAVVVKANLQLAQEMLETARRIAGDGEASLPLLQEQLRMMGEEVAAQRERIAELQQREFNDGQPTTADDREQKTFRITAAAAGTFEDCAYTEILRAVTVVDNCNGWSVVSPVPTTTATVTARDIANSLEPVVHRGQTLAADPSAAVKAVMANAILSVAGGAPRTAQPIDELADEACAAVKEAFAAGGEKLRGLRDPLRNGRIIHAAVGSYNSWPRTGEEMVAHRADVRAQYNKCAAPTTTRTNGTPLASRP
jgi:hypothetical protein